MDYRLGRVHSFSISLRCLAALFTLSLAGPAFADGGHLEINQACALVGCFAGDTGGFPVTISTSGSYRLTSDLTGTVDSTGVDITASDVTFDLGGFSITSAGGTSTAYGIHIATGAGVEVRNGSVSDFRRSGIRADACTGCRVTGMRLHDNGWAGALMSGTAVQYRENVAWGNANAGLYARDGGSFINNTAYNNSFIGIYRSGGTGGVIEGNVAYNNGNDGINATASGVTIRGNSTTLNSGNGISASATSLVIDNTSSGNAQYQLELGSTAAYGRNTISGGGSGTVSGGVQIDTNLCDTNTICP